MFRIIVRSCLSHSTLVLRCLQTGSGTDSPVIAQKFKDTIYALSSGHGKCGVAVIRVSGVMSSTIIKEMGRYNDAPKPRQALLRTVVDPWTREKLDSALMLWFPAPHSFTGEDCVEFQIHGGRAVISACLKTLSSFPNTRHAEPGEFTKRAFINGKLNLTEVEGLADVIHAETEQQRRQAVRQMSGQLGVSYNEWKQLLIKMTAHVEAYIDFSEEENIEENVLDRVEGSVTSLLQRIRAHLADGRRGEILRSGVHVTIVGKPNVGKSSLLNHLTRKQTAIVSRIEGTTRDLIETSLDINGYPVVLADTAGIRSTTDEIEQEGVRRAVTRSQEADLVILMLEITELSSLGGSLEKRLEQYVSQLVKDFLKIDSMEGRRLLIVVNKTDLLKSQKNLKHVSDDITITTTQEPSTTDPSSEILISLKEDNLSHKPSSKHSTVTYPVVFTSLTENHGLIDFMQSLTSQLKELCGDPLQGSASYTQARHRDHLQRSIEHLDDTLLNLHTDVVMAAESLRLACLELGRITGVISSEEILDVVFKDFCIGK